MPRNDTETTLATIWSRLLQLDRVGVNDNFFDIGGHSLLGIQVFAEIEREFVRRAPLASLFQFPTVAGLAQIVDDGVAHYSQDCLVKLQSNDDGVPLLVFHNAAGEVAELRAPLIGWVQFDRFMECRPPGDVANRSCSMAFQIECRTTSTRFAPSSRPARS